jgi:GrpB-like predicted nucleotidyltransferase (UPF0157 family)
MLETIEVRGPTNSPSDRRRASESRKEAKAVARQIVLQMVHAGWRECEAALALADALDDYCLYLAEHPPKAVQAANSNDMLTVSAHSGDS